jgi:hypothetical protein
MTLQSSGAITLANIQTEFGGSNPIGLNEYYAGGTYVPSYTTGVNGAVPSSGAIKLSDFYGTTLGLSTTMTVGSASYTLVKTNYYVDGFIGAGSQQDLVAPTIGSVSPTTFRGTEVKALYWIQVTTGHSGTTGSVALELSGNQASGFVTDVRIAGVSVGSIGTPSYDGTANTTRFSLGTGGTWTNPFGTSGTKAIIIL